MTNANNTLVECLSLYGVEPAALDVIAPLFKPVSFSAGETLLSARERWTQFLIIRQGIVRLYYLDSDGKESNKGFFQAGQVLAPIARSAIEQPVKFYVETLTDVSAYQCNYEKLVSMAGPYDNFRVLFQHLTEQLLEDKINRELMFLQLDARKRYQAFVKNHPKLSQQIPLRHIASYLGMTDVTLSRVRHS